jgi:short coiled-coil protein
MTSTQDDMASSPSESAPTSAHPAAVQASDVDDAPVPHHSDDLHHSSADSSSGSGSDEDSKPQNARLQRPKMGSRKSSGTIIVPRESANIELHDEVYDENDARTMSPRRTSEEIERMSSDAKQTMMEQAKQLQASLLEVVEKVETVKSEHEKLEGGNRFLQSYVSMKTSDRTCTNRLFRYIGELMQTSKITSTGPAKKKGKGRNTK